MNMKLLITPERLPELQGYIRQAEDKNPPDLALRAALPRMGIMPPPQCESIRVVVRESDDKFPVLVADDA